MMYQSEVEFGFQISELCESTIQAAASDQQLVVVFIILAEECAVHQQDAEPGTAHLSQLHRPAAPVTRPASDAFEICVVPGKKGRHFLREVGLGKLRIEVTVGILARGERAGQAYAQRPVNVMIAGDDEEA